MERTIRSYTFMALALSGAMAGCKTELNPLGNYLECTEDGRCLDGYRCAHTELGAICLDDEQWQARCSGSETCNGLDDDCDGETDEEIADLITGTDEGECAVRVERCEGGAWVAVEEGVSSSDEVCDGLDQDCDGEPDNGVPPQLSGFAIGECERSVAECIEGELVVVDVGIEPTDEVCDGLDNDCDGESDEDFVGSDDPDDEILVLDEPCTVGAGTCATDGVGVCDPTGLGVACDAVAGNPSTELCDGLDNDCDGETDETFAELGEPCSVGVGACLASGVRTCRPDGFGTRCGADALASSDETCDGDDNDCDGEIDEGLGDGCCIPGTTRACGTDLGECAVGTQTCSPERSWGACSGQGPIADACNGLDDDCDGETDEGLAGCCGVSGATIPCSVDRGACVAGMQTCGADGTWSACSGVLPTLDRCDGDDNDCDGETDEDFPDLGEPCTVGIGACAASGMKACTVDGLGTTCGTTEGTSVAETCDLVDNDCNGEVDDGLVIVTGTDVGECVEGIERCLDGAWTVVQVRVNSTPELCDGLDNDCDGIADDEAPSCCTPGTVRTCGIETGECTVGSQSCGDDLTWSACSGVAPTAERCDGLDQDCDGTADDQWALLLGTACTVGLGTCARSGVYECNPDFSPSSEGEREGVMCDATPGTPGLETCNGLDDDCDGQIDESADIPPILDGSDVGRCEPRVIACVGGTMVEVYGGVGPTPETCNGLDDDCSGAPDDNIPAFECYEGPGAAEGVGVCTGGLTACADGVLRCAGQVLPNDELCDGLDNDCDGIADGSVDAFTGAPVPLQDSCYTGPTGTADIGECRTGTTTCSAGLWGGCADEVTPDFERCEVLDGLDNDCDGQTDEWQDEMVVVPEGPFLMGSPDGVGNADEHPQHTVTLSRYCIDRYETTNVLYRACVDAGACDPPVSEDSRTRVGYFRDPTYDQYPVMNVTWYMADAFCQWDGKRLPTEAQWEKAARGTDGRTYPWGNDEPTCELAKFYDCPPWLSVAVDTLPLGASPYGAYHMAGNVGEWAWDWYDAAYYASSPTIDPSGPISGTLKVFRSGGIASGALDIRTTRRGNDRLPTDAIDISMRCAQ